MTNSQIAHTMLVALVALLATIGSVAADVVEPKTGVRFPDKKLSRLGVRYKGPIKVYAVGEYADGSYMLKMMFKMSVNMLCQFVGEKVDYTIGIANGELQELRTWL